METVKQIGSYFSWRSQGSDNQESTYSKFTKVAAGVGVAGLAFLSWKIVAAGALAYSAYKGGRYIHSRYFQRHDVRRNSNVGAQAAEAEEHHPYQPVNAGHDAHGDNQDDRRHQPENIERRKEEVVANLRQLQAGYSSKAAKNVFEIMITHPNIAEKGGDLQWIKKMCDKHGPWSKRTFGLSLYAVKAYRKMKGCLYTNNLKKSVFDGVVSH